MNSSGCAHRWCGWPGDVRINATANLGSLVFIVLPALWFVNSALAGFVFAVLRHRVRGLLFALLSTLMVLGIVGAIVVLWLSAAAVDNPGSC